MKFAFKNIHEFNDYFKDEKTCYEFFEKIRWENGKPVCPHCGSTKYYNVKARGKFQDIPSYRCGNRECDLPFTVRTKSVFEGSKVELRKWFQAAYELSICKKGISSVELGQRIGTSQKTAWFINHRLRAMLKETEPTLLRDVVAVDETLIGGKEPNKHADKRLQGTRGRSAVGKNMVVGVRSYTGEVRGKVVPDADGATIKPFIEKNVEKGAMVVTDEWGAYRSIEEAYFRITVNHSEGQYVNGAFSTNGVENFWSIFKRGITGTFHSLSVQHLQSYVDEFADRYNKKDWGTNARFKTLVGRAPLKRITYKELLSRKEAVKKYLTYRGPDIDK